MKRPVIWRKLLAAFIVILVCAGVVRASIMGNQQIQIDFAQESDATVKATWSDPDKLNITANGLGWDGEGASVRDGWFLTKALGIGYAWRPPYGASITAVIQPPPKSFVMSNGSTSTPWRGQLYVRYSADCKNWSSWQALTADDTDLKYEKGISFTGKIQVPHLVREEYDKLLQQYMKMDVPWGSDEEAAVKWIVGDDPKFFERSIPFVGYVQFLYETRFHGGQRIRSFSANVGYGMGGTHQAPKDPTLYKEKNAPWRFKTE